MSALCRHPLAVLAGAFLAWVFGSGQVFAADPPVPSAMKGQRIFTAGHSFHYYLPTALADIAAKAKIEGHQQVGAQPIGGSRVIQHWDLPDDKNKAKAALKTGQVDVLTLSPIYLPDAGIEHFARLALEHNPRVRVTVQESWLPFDDQAAWEPGKRPKTIDRDAKTIDELRTAHANYFQSMAEHVADLNQKLGQEVLFLVPVGHAVLSLREKVIAGEVPGIARQSDLFTDVLGHASAPIMVLATYCHYAVIYRANPVGLPVPNPLKKLPEAEKLNALLQELAWNAVTGHSQSGMQGK